MDLQLVRKHLIEVERHVSDKNITRQIDIIDELERGGNTTLLVVDVLATFRAVRVTHVTRRDLIRKELKL